MSPQEEDEEVDPLDAFMTNQIMPEVKQVHLKHFTPREIKALGGKLPKCAEFVLDLILTPVDFTDGVMHSPS
jgi:hypothetical protein